MTANIERGYRATSVEAGYESRTSIGESETVERAPQLRKSLRVQLSAALTLFVIPSLAPAPVGAAVLKPETVQCWDEYIRTAKARNDERLVSGKSFLASDEIPGRVAKLRAGEILVSPAGPRVPMGVPSGLIHDWIGASFIPNANLDDVLTVVRNYDRYKDFYNPNVVESQRRDTAESKDHFSMVLMNGSVVGKTALAADYESSWTRLDDHHWYSITDAIQIQEIADYDTPAQHALPENHGTGLIWRLHSITRLEERDGGVYVEVEAIALSRDIPAALRWMIEPTVRRVSRSSVATSLRQTASAVRLYSSQPSITSDGSPICTNQNRGPETTAPAAIATPAGQSRHAANRCHNHVE